MSGHVSDCSCYVCRTGLTDALRRDFGGEFDASGIPVADDCPARHPVTGYGCLEPPGHDGLHRAMGTIRIQLFGPDAACSPAPGATP